MSKRPTPDLLSGTLDMLILRTLQTERMHGWAISERIDHYRRHPVVLVRLSTIDRDALRDVLSMSWRLTAHRR